MTAFSSSLDDAERLQALHDLNILDTPREEQYDRIVRTTQALFGVPIVTLALEAENRQWFKASVGLDIHELPRSTAFSSLPTLQQEVFVVEDTKLDEQFKHYHLVEQDPHVRFYAGSVVRGRNGVKVGSLGIFDTKPRVLTDSEKGLLNDLAKWVELEFESIERDRIGQKLRASEERFRRLSEATIEGVAIHTGDTFLEVNERFANMFGFDHPESVVGVSILSVVSPDQHDIVRSFVDVDGTEPYRWTAMRRDGSRFPVESEARSFTLQGSVIRVVAIRDITDQEKTEHRLREAHQKALAASQAKSQFLATMSHEIRTPLNAIIGMADLLHETPLTPEQKRYVEIFQRSGDHLLKLINDILDLSKIEAGQLEMEQIPMSIPALMESIGEIIAVRAHAKGLEVAVHIVPGVPHEIVSDPERLRQIILNLAGNAVKFTEHGEIVIRVQLDVSSNRSQLQFSVLDTGIGIPEEKLQSVFEPFTQADASTTRKYGGSGLGLAISRQLVEAMGGRIWVESVAEFGSHFHFTIPLPTSKAMQTVNAPQMAALHGVRVLVVDDNATNRFILNEMLSYYGADVTEAESGPVALDWINRVEKPFQLVLLDCQMPGMDGFDVAGKIKKNVQSAGVAMMMLTSDNRSGDVSRARQLGIAAYLVKPVKKVELLEVIQQVLQVPQVPASSEVEGAERSDIHVSTKKRVLVAEDSADNRFLIEAFLKTEAYEITFAENGREAVQAFQRQRFDIVLMDMQMPELDGYQATQAIREWEEARPEHAKVPILALTAYALNEDLQKSLSAGCNDHLTKPIRKQTLLDALRKHLNQRTSIRVTIDRDLQDLVPGYLQNRKNDVETMRRALMENKMKIIETLAHQMKGSGGGYGFEFISACGEQLETAAHSRALERIGEVLGKLDSFIQSVDVVYA